MGALVGKGKGSWQRNVVIINYEWILLGEREDEDKRRQENDETLPPFFSFLFKAAFLGHILKRINTFIFWCTVNPLGPRLVYTLRGAQRLCNLTFLKKSYHVSWTMGKGHPS